MIRVLILSVFLVLAGCSGCSNTPKTVAQAQVISYSQIASAMQDANRLYRLKVLDDEQHAQVHKLLTEAYELTIKAEDYKDVPDQYRKAKEEISEIYNKVREMLE